MKIDHKYVLMMLTLLVAAFVTLMVVNFNKYTTLKYEYASYAKEAEENTTCLVNKLAVYEDAEKK